jgi:hypothetical protein
MLANIQSKIFCLPVSHQKTQRSKYAKIVILPVVEYGCEAWSLTLEEHTTYLLYTQFDVFPVNKTILVKKFFRAINRVVWFCFRRYRRFLDHTTRLIARKTFFTRIVLFSGKTSNCVYSQLYGEDRKKQACSALHQPQS